MLRKEMSLTLKASQSLFEIDPVQLGQKIRGVILNVDDERMDINVSNELRHVTAGCDGGISK